MSMDREEALAERPLAPFTAPYMGHYEVSTVGVEVTPQPKLQPVLFLIACG